MSSRHAINGFMGFGLFEKIIKEVSGVRRKPVTHLHGFGEPLLDKLLAERIQLAKTYGITRTYIVTNASLLFPETSRRIISAGLDKMKISFYGTDEESYNNTMKRLNFKVTFQNIKDFLRIRKEMKSATPRLILQYLPNDTNHARTEEFRSLWNPLIDPSVGDCLNVSSLHNYGGGRAYNPLGRRSCRSVISLGRRCQCSGMAGSLPVAWIPTGFRFWVTSTPRVLRKCGMDRYYPTLEATSEGSTTVSIRSVCPAIGCVGVRMAAPADEAGRTVPQDLIRLDPQAKFFSTSVHPQRTSGERSTGAW